MVCNHCPIKDEKHRVRIAVGGDKLPHYDDAKSPVVDFLETKILLNSAISDARQGARFMCLDAKDHFLVTPIQCHECMRVKYKRMPNDIRAKCNIDQIITKDNWVHIKIQKVMLALRQATMLACKHLKNSLEPYGCKPISGTVGLWQCDKQSTKFCLCADYFSVKCWSKADADYLCNAAGANF